MKKQTDMILISLNLKIIILIILLGIMINVIKDEKIVKQFTNSEILNEVKNNLDKNEIYIQNTNQK